MRKITVLFLAAVLAVFLTSFTAQADTYDSSHKPRISVDGISDRYIAPRFGSIELPPEGYLRYPYPDSQFTVGVTAPQTVYTGEPFTIETNIISTMTGPEDPNWGVWLFFQQILVPAGATSPTTWNEQFTCCYDRDNPVIMTGSVTPQPADWLSQYRWYAAGVGSIEHAGGYLVIAPEMAGHHMGPWLWLQDSDSATWSFSPFVIEEPGEYVFELCLTTACYIDATGREEWWPSYEPIRFIVKAFDRVITATIDIKPDILKTKSSGKWITASIEIPGYELADIDVSTIKMSGISAVPGFAIITDRDSDGVPDLNVRFLRQTLVENVLKPGINTVEVTGFIGTKSFAGTDTILVI